MRDTDTDASRRHVLQAGLTILAGEALAAAAATAQDVNGTIEQTQAQTENLPEDRTNMSRHVKHVSTKFGDIAYTEQGEGPAALFVHGIFLNGYVWRHVIDRVADLRRCIAIDILAHGQTRTPTDAEVSFNAHADMLEAFCDALGLQTVDLVTNDSGGGIGQIFGARHPERIRTVTLTNCDVHDNYPPPALEPLMAAVRAGQLGALGAQMVANPDVARQTLAVGYENPQTLTNKSVAIYLAPLFSTPQATALLSRMIGGLDHAQNVAIEPKLRTLQAPALIVWGTGDVFFDVKWAHWLHKTLPRARDPIILDGARLFFPEERPEAFAAPLRAFWQSA